MRRKQKSNAPTLTVDRFAQISEHFELEPGDRIRLLHESFLSTDAQKWLHQWVTGGGVKDGRFNQRNSDVEQELEEKGLNLNSPDIIYRGVETYSDKDEAFWKDALGVHSLRDIDDRRTYELNIASLSSWTTDIEVAKSFTGLIGVLLSAIVKPEQTVFYANMLPFYFAGFEESEVILKPGTYKCKAKLIQQPTF